MTLPKLKPFLVLPAFLTLGSIILVIDDHSYNDEMFRKAILNESTSDDWVLISVSQRVNQSVDYYAVKESALEYAMHEELGLPFDNKSRDKVEKLLMLNQRRVFQFSKKKALEAIKREYSDSDLLEIRNRTRWKMNWQLEQPFFVSDNIPIAVMPYYRRQAAVAHVMLERGIRFQSGCFGDYPVRQDRLIYRVVGLLNLAWSKTHYDVD